MLAGVGARGQLAVHRRLDQHAGVGHQRVDRVDAGVEVVLQNVEVAVVGVGDLGRNIAPADPVHIVGGHVQWADDRVQRVVHALHDLAEVALMLGSVSAGGQLPVHRRLDQQPRVCHQRVDRVDAGVEVVLQNVEVAVVAVRDLGRNVAPADAIDVIRRYIQRCNHGVENAVYAAHNLRVRALELIVLAALGELAFLGSVGQPRQFLLKPLQHDGHIVDRLLHLLVVALVGLRQSTRRSCRWKPAPGCGCLRRWAAESRPAWC